MNKAPSVGDIVVYVGASDEQPWKRRREERVEHLIVRVRPRKHELDEVTAVGMREPLSEWFILPADRLRVVRHARYEEVPE